MDPLTITLQVTALFESLQIPYFLGGSLAGILYGDYRTTNDADIVADIKAHHRDRLVAHWTPDFYVNGAEIDLALATQAQGSPTTRLRPSFNIIHHASGFKIDLFLPTQHPFEQSEFRRRIAEPLVDTPNGTAYVATAEDLVLAKLEWAEQDGLVSAQQWRDVVAILRVQGDQLDAAYLTLWAERLGVTHLLAQARTECETPSAYER